MELEVCQIYDQTEEDKLSGRTRIVMSGLEINESGNFDDYNENGIHWEEEYVLKQINTCINMPFVVRFITNEFSSDEEDSRRYISDHGRYFRNEEGGFTFPDSTVVGTVTKAYIGKKLIENKERKVLICEGVLYSQRYNAMVVELKKQIAEGFPVKGSIEITPKKDNDVITYINGQYNEDGTLKMGRCPCDFQFSGLALLSTFVQPADKASELLEINSKVTGNKPDNIDNKNKEEIKVTIEELKAKVAELEKTIAEKDEELNACKKESETCKKEYETCKKELETCKAELYSKTKELEGKQVTDTIETNSVTVRDIEQNVREAVAEKFGLRDPDGYCRCWVSYLFVDDQIAYVNTDDLNEFEFYAVPYDLNDGEVTCGEITKVTMSVKPIDAEKKIVELNETIVKATKDVESKDAIIAELNSEIEPLREMKREADTKKAQAEVNAYFEQVKENGFDEAELNSLKEEFVDKCDLAGLKAKEAELCVKKLREMSRVQKDTAELNSLGNKDDLLFSTKVEYKKDEEDHFFFDN